MAEQQGPDPVDLDKLEPPVPAPPPPPPEVVPEPAWRNGRCPTCGRPQMQHRNPNGSRWWDCWELDAIDAEQTYWGQRWWGRIGKTRPPELRPNPTYVPGEPGSFPTRLVQPETFWQQLRRIGRL